MTDKKTSWCPECAADVAVAGQGSEPRAGVDRRDFLRAMGGTAAGLMGGTALLSGWAGRPAMAFAEEAAAKPAEGLIRELFATLTPDQKKTLVLPWDHGADAEGKNPTRLQTFNAALKGTRIGEAYTKPQQELIQRTLKAILSGEDAFTRLERGGNWDGSGSFEGNGAVIFGDPTGDKPFSWMFAGHHLTLRCDGNSQPGAAFGGPMYYGHSANGHSATNVYNYQTKQVKSVFDALDEKQRTKALVVGEPGDGRSALRFRKVEERQGIAYADLSDDQRKHVEATLRLLLDPFRKEDGDEVMQLVKANGGMEKIQLAFYKDDAMADNERWHYWRLEGPGFIWNYRVLPHVHCFVNIVGQA